jgi:thiol:disulfide interchange protein DsbD
MAWRTFRITKSTVNRIFFIPLGILLIVIALILGIRFTDKGPIDWVYYTPMRLHDAQQERRIVMLEFTAQWCLNCHALEQAVLRNGRVVEAIGKHNVVPIKVDLTGNNELGNRQLVASGRRTIPLLVIFDRHGNEVFKSDAYTVDQVVEALELAAQSEQSTLPSPTR